MIKLPQNVEQIEQYRLVPTDRKAGPLRTIVDFFLYRAPGIDAATASRPISPEKVPALVQRIRNDAHVSIENYKVCSRHVYRLTSNEMAIADFSARFIYCHKRQKENEIQAILRHVRNALAHGNLFVKFLKKDTRIIFLDYDTDRTPSAKLIINKATLERWIKVLSDEQYIE